MNQRIRELAEQARLGRGPEKIQIRENGVVIFYLNELEKFALLIVQECGRVLEDNELGGYRVHYVLREHFSVDKD